MNLFDRNLKLLSARYPGREEALKKWILSQPAEKRQQASIEPLKPRPYAPKIGLVFGYFNKQALTQLMKDPVCSEIASLQIIENDPSAVRAELEQEDWTGMLVNPLMNFYFGYDEDSFPSALYQVIRNPEISMIYQVCLVTSHPSLSDSERQFYSQFPRIFKETTTHYTSNLGSINDYIEGVRATAANAALIRTLPGVHELRGRRRDRPALLVGAGPSLDGAMDLIKQREKDFTIIVADAAVKKLAEAGIKADYAVSIERFNTLHSKFWTGLDEFDSSLLPELVAFPVVHPDSFALFPGKIRLVYRNYAYYTGFEHANPKGMIHSYGSCMHLGLRLASWIGAPHSYLIGCDMCYEEIEPGLYQSHAAKLAYEQWGEAKPQKWFEDNLSNSLKPYSTTKNYLGKTVLTNRVYRNFASQWGYEAAEKEFVGRITQCSPSPPLNYIPYKPFEQAVNEVPCQLHPKPDIPHKVNKAGKAPPYHVWTAQLRGYARRFSDLYNVLKNNPVNSEELQCLHVYLKNISHTEIFCSNWIIQCCTREYYTCWNEINKLSLNMESDDEETKKTRIQAYQQLLLVLHHTAKKLEKSLEEAL